MKTYIIKSNYEKEIEANSPEEALEKWNENIEEDLASRNTTIVNEFVDSLEAEEINDVNNAQHPSRQKAIKILEEIAEKAGNENMFDGEKWYELEDQIVKIIEGEN